MRGVLDRIFSWERLLDFCNEHQCDVCSNVYSENAVASMLTKEMQTELTLGTSWVDLRYRLLYIEKSDFYLREGRVRYVGLDKEDFMTYKQRVKEWLFDNHSDINNYLYDDCLSSISR